MDPNKTLEEIRGLVTYILSESSRNARGEVNAEDATALAQCAQDLDAHLSRGGELPEDWKA